MLHVTDVFACIHSNPKLSAVRSHFVAEVTRNSTPASPAALEVVLGEVVPKGLPKQLRRRSGRKIRSLERFCPGKAVKGQPPPPPPLRLPFAKTAPGWGPRRRLSTGRLRRTGEADGRSGDGWTAAGGRGACGRTTAAWRDCRARWRWSGRGRWVRSSRLDHGARGAQARPAGGGGAKTAGSVGAELDQECGGGAWKGGGGRGRRMQRWCPRWRNVVLVEQEIGEDAAWCGRAMSLGREAVEWIGR
jgi:hypothetical protein